jgi:hypothetical protein
MSTDKFLLALQRFVGRRGLPHIVYTDDAQTFHATNKHWLFYGPLYLQAKLTTSSLITLVRSLLLRGQLGGKDGGRLRYFVYVNILGRLQVSEEGLNTILVAKEAAINSRPIVQAEDEAGALISANSH